MNELTRKHLMEWVHTAHSDFEVAQRLFSEEEDVYILKICCFHLQQSIEKYLKTFLIFHQIDPPYTHDIAILLNLCSKIEPPFSQFDIRQINDFAVTARYPDTTYIPDVGDIKYYISLTLSVENFVTLSINIHP